MTNFDRWNGNFSIFRQRDNLFHRNDFAGSSSEPPPSKQQRKKSSSSSSSSSSGSSSSSEEDEEDEEEDDEDEEEDDEDEEEDEEEGNDDDDDDGQAIGGENTQVNHYYPAIIPKEHYLVHLTHQIELFGPIARALSTHVFEGKHQSTKTYLKRSGNRINVLKSVANELERQTAFHAKHSGLVCKAFQFTPVTSATFQHDENTAIRDVNGQILENCKSFSINNIVYKKSQFYELSSNYVIKVLDTLKNEKNEFFLFGQSFQVEEDQLTGVHFATPWEPAHLVLCHIKPFTTRVFNREKEFFDSDQQNRQLISYGFKNPHNLENDHQLVALFFWDSFYMDYACAPHGYSARDSLFDIPPVV